MQELLLCFFLLIFLHVKILFAEIFVEFHQRQVCVRNCGYDTSDKYVAGSSKPYNSAFNKQILPVLKSCCAGD